MASFCSNCGTPVAGKFCSRCGSAVSGTAAQGTAAQGTAAPAAAKGSGSAMKLILIVVGVFFLLGAMGVASMIYVGYRAKQKLTAIAHEYGVTGDSSSSSSAPARDFPPPRGNCPLLDGREASRILGAAIDRMEFTSDGSEGSQECRFWITAAERRRLTREQIASGIGAVGKGGDQANPEDVEKIVGGALGAVIEAAGDNKNEDYAFQVQVWRSRGQAMWDKMESAKTQAQGATGIDFGKMLAVQPVEGVGDKATILPAGHSIMVLKGDSFLLLGFQQFVPGRDKTAALARAAVAGL